jgi:multiple sugar transport system substrate-binding protein
MRVRSLLVAAALVCGACGGPAPNVLTFSGSAVGREADLVRVQLARFQVLHPGWTVELRATPDAADQRHQLYVQWLNARAADPDVLQLDVIWTPEFAAAGWIRPLTPFHPDEHAFFPATLTANRWRGTLYALPWFVDVGMLYWRTDLMPHAPATFDELTSDAARATREARVHYGFVWQGARYEGLVTTFVEILGGFGGEILDGHGRVTVDSDAAVRALTWMRDAIYRDDVSPSAVLTWQEEQTRFAFQNGDAAMMRNWPYAVPLLDDRSQSHVAGRFQVAPMPAQPGGTSTSSLGGSQLAINAHSRHPDLAYELIEYLTAPPQMLERAREVGQYPSRPALYDTQALAASIDVPPSDVRRIIERAEPRPVTPVYTQLSEILQVQLHRALTRQQEPRPALEAAARQMRALLARTGLAEQAGGAS